VDDSPSDIIIVTDASVVPKHSASIQCASLGAFLGQKQTGLPYNLCVVQMPSFEPDSDADRLRFLRFQKSALQRIIIAARTHDLPRSAFIDASHSTRWYFRRGSVHERSARIHSRDDTPSTAIHVTVNVLDILAASGCVHLCRFSSSTVLCGASSKQKRFDGLDRTESRFHC
jgi:hypothetical protein